MYMSNGHNIIVITKEGPKTNFKECSPTCCSASVLQMGIFPYSEDVES